MKSHASINFCTANNFLVLALQVCIVPGFEGRKKNVRRLLPEASTGWTGAKFFAAAVEGFAVWARALESAVDNA